MNAISLTYGKLSGNFPCIRSGTLVGYTKICYCQEVGWRPELPSSVFHAEQPHNNPTSFRTARENQGNCPDSKSRGDFLPENQKGMSSSGISSPRCGFNAWGLSRRTSSLTMMTVRYFFWPDFASSQLWVSILPSM